MMADKTITIDEELLLLCPECGYEYTRVDGVRVAARKEDREPNAITVDAVSGQVVTHADTYVPAGMKAGTGHHHRIALMSECENGHSFAIVFTQHQGKTYGETVLDFDS
jgi:hypothetical protein